MRPEGAETRARRPLGLVLGLGIFALVSLWGALRLHVSRLDADFQQRCQDANSLGRPETELALSLLRYGARPQHAIPGQTSYPMLILGIHSVGCEVFADDAGLVTRTYVVRVHWLEVYMPRSDDVGLPEVLRPPTDALLLAIRDVAIWLLP